MLRAQNLQLHIALADAPALQLFDGLDFSLNAGESVAILGASGSGKSSLLQVLAGLQKPTQGQVFWQECELYGLSDAARARLRAQQLGFVFQNFQLLGRLSALDNVRVALDLAGQPTHTDQALALLSQVGLSHRARHLPSQLSGGEQQRVALARALVHQPRLIFADEPTANLDGLTAARVLDVMFDLLAQQQVGLLLVTHDPAVAARCQRCYHLQQGRLVLEPQA